MGMMKTQRSLTRVCSALKFEWGSWVESAQLSGSRKVMMSETLTTHSVREQSMSLTEQSERAPQSDEKTEVYT